MKNKKIKKTVPLLTGLLIGIYLLLKLLIGNQETICVRVIDGDTIKTQNKEMNIRLIGIDAPELGKAEEKDECFTQEAKKILEQIIANRKIKLEYDKDKYDRFGRLLAYVYADKQMVNLLMLEMGGAKFFPDQVNDKYQDQLIKAAEKARLEKKGLWQVCGRNKAGCLIKGNIDKNDNHWYHLPEFRHYNQVVVSLNQGDQWFCSEEEAVKAGFNKARE